MKKHKIHHILLIINKLIKQKSQTDTHYQIERYCLLYVIIIPLYRHQTRRQKQTKRHKTKKQEF